MRAIRVEQWGGPEVLQLVEDAPMPEPGQHDLLVRVNRAGINYADTHAAENSYLSRQTLPLIPGSEIAGTTEDGRRVMALLASGGYAEYAVVPMASAIPIPDGVSDEQALALLVQGLTAWHLYKTSARLAEGESVVVHAAAGGVGSLAVQLGKAFGAGRVIATASTEEKRQLALELGADVAVDVTVPDLARALREANHVHGVDVVLEMAGGHVFDESLKALAPFGRLVTYGISSGENNTLRSGSLMRHSRAVVGFWFAHCIGRPAMIDEALADLFERVRGGELRVVTGPAYPLAEAAKAQDDLAERRTTGKITLDPTI
jgi:NADPH:quinone reductase